MIGQLLSWVLVLASPAWSLTANDCFPIGAGACTTGTFAGQVLDTNGSTLNVKAYGALGTGLVDDAPSIQLALNVAKAAGGGRVYLPPGTYRLNDTLLIGDNVELAGAGASSILKRYPVTTMVALSNTACVLGGGGTLSSWVVLSNDKYNCGNIGIALHDFAIDGTAITTMPCTSCTGGPTNVAVGISFSALVDTRIYNLTLTHMPQDGIFLKNAGVRTDVHHNTINGCGELWGNAGCINVEMHTGVANAANDPGTISISDNYIVADGPDFCDNDFHQTCQQDSDCTSGVCAIGGGGSAVNGINAIFTSDAGGTVPPKAIIARNRFELTDNHQGISTVGMQGGEIVENWMAPFTSGTLMSQVYAGIIVQGVSTRSALDTIISGNVVLGGGIANDRRPLLVSGSGANSGRVKVLNNIFTNRNLRSSFLAALEFRGIGSDSEVIGNTVQGIAGNHAVSIGLGSACSADDVVDVKVLNNTISDVTTASRDCLALNCTTRAAVAGNVFRNCPRAIELRLGPISGTFIGPNFGYSSVTTKLLQSATDTTLVDVDPNIRVDLTAAPSTASFKSGTSAGKPATCLIGDTYFCTDCVAGQNYLGCTASNTWTAQGTTGSAVATASNLLMIPDHLINVANSAGATTLLTASNQMKCVPFVPPVGVTAATKMVFGIATASGNCGLCLYNAAGTTLVTQTGAQDCSVSTNKLVTGLTAFSLTAGTTYILCYTGDNQTFTLRASANGGANNGLLNAVVVREGTAANAGTAGACPATTGTITTASVIPPYAILFVE